MQKPGPELQVPGHFVARWLSDTDTQSKLRLKTFLPQLMQDVSIANVALFSLF